MQQVVLKPGRAEWKALSIGLIVLCAVMMLLPPLCVVLALALPLLICPLVGQKQEPAAYIAACVPTASSLLAGYDPLYAVSLLLIPALPLLLRKTLPAKKSAGMDGMLWYVGAVALALTAVVCSATYVLGGPLWKSISALAVDFIGQHKRAEQILLQAASSGLVRMPEGYQQSDGLLGLAMGAAHKQQMLMSLRLTLETMLYSQLAGMFVQACLLVGVFTHLRILRFRGAVLVVQTITPSERKTTVTVPPGFRLLTLPPRTRQLMAVLAVAALMLLGTPGTYAQTVGQLCFALVEQVFTLIGAAVMIHVFCRNDPDRKTACGAFAALAYVVAPFALFMIGLMDQFLHFRSNHSGKPENP